MNNEAALRVAAGHVITLYDLGVPKDRIAEMVNIPRNDVDDMIAHRKVLGR